MKVTKLMAKSLVIGVFIVGSYVSSLGELRCSNSLNSLSVIGSEARSESFLQSQKESSLKERFIELKTESLAEKARLFLGRSGDLDQTEKKALFLAHIEGAGEIGKDGTWARRGNYTLGQLKRKFYILKRAGFLSSEIRKLMRVGVVGLFDDELLELDGALDLYDLDDGFEVFLDAKRNAEKTKPQAILPEAQQQKIAEKLKGVIRQEVDKSKKQRMAGFHGTSVKAIENLIRTGKMPITGDFGAEFWMVGYGAGDESAHRYDAFEEAAGYAEEDGVVLVIHKSILEGAFEIDTFVATHNLDLEYHQVFTNSGLEYDYIMEIIPLSLRAEQKLNNLLSKSVPF